MAEMSVRERYHAVMHFGQGVRSLRWEFGYWNATVQRWYREGLKRTAFSPPLDLPPGEPLIAEASPFPPGPGVVLYRDLDVHDCLNLDDGTVRVPLNWRHCPQFRERTLDEDETTRLMVNVDGVTVRVRKGSDSLPQCLAWPVQDRADWERIKEERFGRDIAARFPSQWQSLVGSYRGHSYPLGVRMDGFFGFPRELLGLTRQLMMYYDDPPLMHDINSHLADVWLAMLEEVVAAVDLDFVYVWEDMSYKNGPFISPQMFHEFILPYYQRVTTFLRHHDVNAIFVDTDGDCWRLIPGFLEAGVTGLYPFEAQAGMDVVEVRRRYPQLLIQGGLNKMKVAQGGQAIDEELETKLPFLLSQGGYVPFLDHMVPPDISWNDFSYYRQKVNQYIERYQPR